MSKRSGNKGSRSERNAGRQRAQRAREHGLPQRREPEVRRARAATPEPRSAEGEDPSSDAAPKRKAGIPPLAKLAAVALLLLGGAYALTHFRDRNELQPTQVEPGTAPAAPAPAASAP